MKDTKNLNYENAYQSAYQIYKLLPFISCICSMVAALAWMVIDLLAFSGYQRYGILRLESPILPILIWMVVGIVLAVLTFFYTAVAISPTVVRTDAVLKIVGEKEIAVEEEELPEL